MFGKKFLALGLSLAFLLAVVATAFAGDRDISVKDLKGISPHRHRYIFAVVGGGVVGAGLGALVGGAPNVGKGMLLGAGGMSALYLHSHRSTGGAYRDWLFIGSHAALGTGIGWTACGCNKGALVGGLVGGGASAIWRSMAPDRGITTASTTASDNTADELSTPDLSVKNSEKSETNAEAQRHLREIKLIDSASNNR